MGKGCHVSRVSGDRLPPSIQRGLPEGVAVVLGCCAGQSFSGSRDSRDGKLPQIGPIQKKHLWALVAAVGWASGEAGAKLWVSRGLSPPHSAPFILALPLGGAAPAMTRQAIISPQPLQQEKR